VEEKFNNHLHWRIFMPAQFCSYCNAPLVPDAKFCEKCGHPVIDTTNAPVNNFPQTPSVDNIPQATPVYSIPRTNPAPVKKPTNWLLIIGIILLVGVCCIAAGVIAWNVL
jgi:hypothetical protein